MDQVEAAIQTSHSPSSPPEVRAQALELLKQFQRSPACGDWAFNVLRRPDAPAEYRHFALQCLSTLIKLQWKEWSADTKAQFRQATLQLLENVGACSEVFMRERVALLVSDVGERQFPGEWPSMLEDFMAIWDSSAPIPAIVVFMAFRNIAEDCIDSDFNSSLPTQRRNDMLREISAALPTFMPRLFAFMSRMYEGREQNPLAADILRASLQLLSRLIQWINPDLVFQAEWNFMNVFSTLALQEATRMDALECLKDLAYRRCETKEQGAKVLEGLEGAISALATIKSVWSDLACCEVVCQALAGFVATNLDRLLNEEPRYLEPQQTPESAMLFRLIELLVQLLGLPFLRTAVILQPAVTSFYKHDRIKAAADGNGQVVTALRQALPALLDVFTEASVKVKYEDGSFVGRPVLDEEFVDVEEYRNSLGSLRASLAILYPLAAQFCPQMVVEFIHNRLTRLINQYGGATGVDVHSEAYAHLEGFANPLSRLLGGVPEPTPQNPEPDVIAKIAPAASVVVEWRTNDPLLLYCQCQLMEGFKRFYRHLGPQLWAVMDRLFSYMEYRDPNLMGVTFPDAYMLINSLTPPALQIRRRSVSSMVEICNNVPDMLLPYLVNLCERCRQLVMQGDVTDGQRPQLIEMLVVVANAITDQAQKAAFLADIISDGLTYWTSQEFAATLASVDSFLEALQVTTTASTEEERSLRTIKYTMAVQGALQTFLGVGRRLQVPKQDDITSTDAAKAAKGRALVYENLSLDVLATINPMVPLWAHIFPPFISFLSIMHQLWMPDTRRRLMAHPEARHLVSMSEEEIKTRLPHGSVKVNVPKNASLPKRWAGWITHIRQSCYQLVAQSCAHKVLYNTPGALQALETTAVQHLPHMEHRHVILFLRFCVEPYITHCPLPLLPTHLPPILIPLMSHMPFRLTVTWSGGLPAPSQGGPIACAADLESLVVGGLYLLAEDLTAEDYETILDRSRRDVTREYMDALYKCLSLKGEVVQAMHKRDKRGKHWKGSSGGEKGGSAMVESMDGDGDGVVGMEEESADGEAKPMIQEFKDALTRFIVVENEDLVVRLLLSVVGGLSWPDSCSCRRAIRLGHYVVEVGYREPKLQVAFAQDLFREVMRALLSNHPWLSGIEDELVFLACDIYRLVIVGDDLRDVTVARRADVINYAPRQLLLSLPGLINLSGFGSVAGLVPADLEAMEARMKGTRVVKEQREAFRDVCKAVAQELQNRDPALIRKDSLFKPSPNKTGIPDAPHFLPSRAFGHMGKTEDVDFQASLQALFGHA